MYVVASLNMPEKLEACRLAVKLVIELMVLAIIV
jgi:hypothetical protein